MTPSSSVRPLRASATAEAGFDYFATEAHYRSLAGRIITALGGFSVVVVTGDPRASAPSLATALGEATGSRHTVIVFSCGAVPGRRDLPHFWRGLSASLASVNTTEARPEPAAPGPPLVVFDDTDRLSDEQIEEIFKNLYPRTQLGDCRIAAAVLLAHPEFLARLERPVLHFWLAKRLLVARLRFQELGADEIPAFIRHQLPSSEAEDAFTPEAMTAIANVSGGDPIVVNRFSRRLLDFAAAAGGESTARTAVAPPAIVPAEMPREERGTANLDEPPTRIWRGSGTGLKLSAGILFCLACIGVAAVLLLHPAEEKIVASGTPFNPVAVTVPEGGSSTDEALPSGAGVAASAVPTPGSPPEALAGSAAEPAPNAGPAAAGGTQQEAASPVTTPTGGSLTSEAAPSGTGVTASATPTPGSPPEEAAGSPAQPAPTAGPAAAGGTQQEAATPVVTPAPAASPAGTVPAAAAVPITGIAEATSTVPTPVPIAPTAPPRLSAAEIAALLARGDRMFALGDIASARLFYERAAEAGDGGAALKSAKTFDPVALHFARVYGVRGDADRAAYWYRRAHDLGEAEAR